MRSGFEMGTGADSRVIAVEARPGDAPAVVWFGGFRSDMTGTKAEALDAWAAAQGRAFVRFDYSGHGASGGDFEDRTITDWAEEGVAVTDAFTTGRPILVGSSMGAWLALLATRHLRRNRPDRAPAALVLIAPAVDFTERLMWDAFSPEIRARIMETGRYVRPSLYAEEGYPITRKLIESGRQNLLLDGTIETGCPVHIIQGMQDPDVPWEHAMRLVEHLPGDSVQITLIKDGDHRLSRPEDIERIVAAVAAAGRPSRPAEPANPQLRLTV